MKNIRDYTDGKITDNCAYESAWYIYADIFDAFCNMPPDLERSDPEQHEQISTALAEAEKAIHAIVNTLCSVRVAEALKRVSIPTWEPKTRKPTNSEA